VVEDIDAGDGVSITTPKEGNGKPPLYFSRVNAYDENKKVPEMP